MCMHHFLEPNASNHWARASTAIHAAVSASSQPVRQRLLQCEHWHGCPPDVAWCAAWPPASASGQPQCSWEPGLPATAACWQAVSWHSSASLSVPSSAAPCTFVCTTALAHSPSTAAGWPGRRRPSQITPVLGSSWVCCPATRGCAPPPPWWDPTTPPHSEWRLAGPACRRAPAQPAADDATCTCAGAAERGPAPRAWPPPASPGHGRRARAAFRAACWRSIADAAPWGIWQSARGRLHCSLSSSCCSSSCCSSSRPRPPRGSGPSSGGADPRSGLLAAAAAGGGSAAGTACHASPGGLGSPCGQVCTSLSAGASAGAGYAHAPCNTIARPNSTAGVPGLLGSVQPPGCFCGTALLCPA